MLYIIVGTIDKRLKHTILIISKNSGSHYVSWPEGSHSILWIIQEMTILNNF